MLIGLVKMIFFFSLFKKAFVLGKRLVVCLLVFMFKMVKWGCLKCWLVKLKSVFVLLEIFLGKSGIKEVFKVLFCNK